MGGSGGVPPVLGIKFSAGLIERFGDPAICMIDDKSIASRGPLPQPLQPLPPLLNGISDHVEVYVHTSTHMEYTCRRDE